MESENTIIMDIIKVISGIIAGAGAMYAKDLFTGGDAKQKLATIQHQFDSLSDENEKLRKRNRDAESQIESLLAESEKLRRKAKDSDDDKDDLEDDLDLAKQKIHRLETDIEGLTRQIKELKMACQAYEEQIINLKK